MSLRLLPLGSLGDHPGILNVKDSPYNAVGDGVVDDTAAVQAALDAADALHGVGTVSGYAGSSVGAYFPHGTYKVGTLTWRLQSLIGESMGASTLLGKPGLDVLHIDPSLAFSARANGVVRDLTIVVDDSVNASATFTTRGGVGNAGIALDYNAAATGTEPLCMNLMTIENVRMYGKSYAPNGQNASCGIYDQYAGPANNWRNVKISRFVYGIRHSYPATGVTTVDIGGDDNHYDGLYFDLCARPLRIVNLSANTVFTNLTMHNLNATEILRIDKVTSLYRYQPANIVFNGLMIEDVGTNAATVPLAITGTNLVFNGGSISGPWATTTFGADECIINNLTMGSTVGGAFTLTITGNRNLFNWGSLLYSIPADVIDQGFGNIVTSSHSAGIPDRQRLPVRVTRNVGVLHERDAGMAMMGYVNPLGLSEKDLLVSPVSFNPPALTMGTGYFIDYDSASDLGHVLRVVAPGGMGNATNYAMNGENFVFGSMIPLGKFRVYVKGKVSTAATQACVFGSNVLGSLGSTTFSWTTSYTVQSFEVDATAATTAEIPYLDFNNTSVSGSFYVQWVLIRPYHADLLVTGAPAFAVKALTYGATIATNCLLGGYFQITATNGTAYTISNPTNATAGMEIAYEIKNSSGGVMGAVTWGSDFSLAGAFTNPANTTIRTISFRYNGFKWVEQNRAAADI